MSTNSLRRTTKAMRAWDWAFPSPPIAHREVLSQVPTVDAGKPPLLMVHGVAHAAWCFDEHWIGAAAEAGYRSYAVSLRGHGGSGGARRLRRSLIRDYVHDVKQAIVGLPSPPVLIGHSMGGIVSQLVAEQYPLRGLVLLAPAPMHSALGSLLKHAGERPWDAAATVAGRTLSMDPALLFEGLDSQTAQRYSDRTGLESPLVQYEMLLRRRVGPIRCPVMVIGSPQDRLVRTKDIERTASAYGVEPIWFPGMGHDLMLDAGWDRVLAAVLDFVADLPEWGTPVGR